MSDITIGVSIIAGKDRKSQLERLLPQLEAFDQVVLVNTSGQGYMKNLAKKHKNVEYHEFAWRPTPFTGTVRSIKGSGFEEAAEGMSGPNGAWENGEYRETYDLNDWGFSGARNFSFSKLRTTHALWLDTDDLLGVSYQGQHLPIKSEAAVEALRKIAREAPDVDVWFMDYIYSRDDADNANVVHARERFLRLECGWRWVYPIHECLVPGHRPQHSVIKDVEVLHYPDAEKTENSAERNMRMLKDWLWQLEGANAQHDLQRCRLLIGETYWGMERYRECAEWLEHEFLARHPEAISLEKWQAACFASKSYIQIGNLGKARKMALMALDFEAALPDAYFLLAEIKLLNEEDPSDVMHLIETGGRMPDPPPQVIKNPLDYTFTPFLLTSEAKYQQEQYEVALDFALKAQKIRPNDPKAEMLRRRAAEALRGHEGQQAALALYQILRDFDEHEKAHQLFNLLPYKVQAKPEIYKVASGAEQRVRHLLSAEEYEKYYSDPPGWQPVPWNFFEEGKIPARDRYDYLLARLRFRPDVKKVLWVGCEDGFHALLLAKQGYEVVGIDLNEEAIRIANERAEALGVKAVFIKGWIEKLRLDATPYPFEEGKTLEEQFDAVIASEQIDRARDVEFFMESLGDAIRPGGIILLTTPDGSWDGGEVPYSRKEGSLPRSVRAFTQNTMEALLGSNQEYHLSECHFLPYSQAYREKQGWIVSEIAKNPRPNGPVIRIYCGELVEPFSPTNLLTGGIGGSETAVIHMASFWAKMGCQVVVYGNNVGIYDGVLYRHADDWSHEFRSDIFIAWRLPHLFAKFRPNATVNVLWCHDIHYPIDVRPEWMENIDIIAVLSEFHKKWIMGVHPFPEEKVWVTRNGIDPLRYMQKVEKKPYNYFFTSSHERGLQELLVLWPEIRKAIPEATLHVGYGTQTAAGIMKQRGDYEGLDELRGMEQLMYESEGVVYHGRMNQYELARVQMECEAWLYPYQKDGWDNGGFLETSCITKFEAMAAKCMIISRLNGALPESLPHVIEWTSDMGIQEIIDILKNPSKYWKPEWTEENYRVAMAWNWEDLAVEWLRKFKEISDALQRSREAEALHAGVPQAESGSSE